LTNQACSDVTGPPGRKPAVNHRQLLGWELAKATCNVLETTVASLAATTDSLRDIHGAIFHHRCKNLSPSV